jgi:hypothetical protein
MERPRTEDDLRAAFTLAAQDAPSSEDVLAAVHAASTAPTPRARAARTARLRRWTPIVAVAAVVVAVAVPVGIAISDDKSGSSSASSGTGYDVGGKAAAPEAAGSSAAANAAGATSAGAVGGPVNSPGLVSPPASAPSAGRICAPADLTMGLRWTSGAHGLTGVLEVMNHTASACDLAVKPAIYPLDAAGQRLADQNVNTAEGYSGPQRLLAGASASSTILWTSWCGARAGERAEVDWGSGVGTVEVATGPTTPACANGTPASISSGWFTPLS